MRGVVIAGWVGIAVLITCLATPATVMAAPASDNAEQTPVLRALADCRAITDSAPRLACFDRAAAALIGAQATGDVVVLDRPQVQRARRQVFGLNFNALNVFNRPGDSGDLTSVNDVVAAARQLPYGFWELTLQSGAVWRQIDGDSPYREPHAGSKVVIDRAALGSFKMSIDGQDPIRVHRDR